MKGQARQTILAGARLSDRKGLGLAVLPSLFSRLYGEVPNTVALIDSCARAAPPSGHTNKDTVANVIRRANRQVPMAAALGHSQFLLLKRSPLSGGGQRHAKLSMSKARHRSRKSEDCLPTLPRLATAVHFGWCSLPRASRFPMNYLMRAGT